LERNTKDREGGGLKKTQAKKKIEVEKKGASWSWIGGSSGIWAESRKGDVNPVSVGPQGGRPTGAEKPTAANHTEKEKKKFSPIRIQVVVMKETQRWGQKSGGVKGKKKRGEGPTRETRSKRGKGSRARGDRRRGKPRRAG